MTWREEQWSEIYSEYILKVEPNGFADGFDVILKLKKKKISDDTLRFLSQTNRRMELLLTDMRKTMGKATVWGVGEEGREYNRNKNKLLRFM